MTAPRIVERSEQPYVAITTSVTMEMISATLPPLLGEVFSWLDARQVAPAGPPFFKYNIIDMERELEIEVGVPVAVPVTGDERVAAGHLPAGRYATLTHTGHPDGLYEATGHLLEWAREQGLTWDMTAGDGGEHWRARLEWYKTDPQDEPNMDRWESELSFRLADSS